MILRIAGFPSATTYYAIVYNGETEDGLGIFNADAEFFDSYSPEDPYIVAEDFAIPLTESINHDGLYYSEALALEGEWTALVYEQEGSSPDLSADPLRSVIEERASTIINNNTTNNNTTTTTGGDVTADDLRELLEKIDKKATRAMKRERPRER